jgi:DNA mismatch repair protein MutS2
VYVARLRAEAEIVEVMGDQVRVAAGMMKLVVPLSELREPEAADAEARGGRDAGRASPRDAGPGRTTDQAKLEVPHQTSDNTVDVRGMRSDDAVSMTMTFLDRAVGQGLRVVFVVHGHGTGALRDAIRRELRSSRYVAFFRPGEQFEGGDGATLVWLT